MKRTKLLPCPYCGSKAKMIHMGNREYRVACTKVGTCYGDRGELGYTYESDAAEQWNMRRIPGLDIERNLLAMKLHIAECFIPCNCNQDWKLPWSAHSKKCPKKIYLGSITAAAAIQTGES